MDLRIGTFVRQGMRQHVRVLEDYEPLTSRRLGTFLAAINGMPPPRTNVLPVFTGSVSSGLPFARPQLFDLVAVRALQLPVSRMPAAGIPGWTRIGQIKDLATYLNANALPRAYVVHRARFAPTEAEALDIVTAGDFDPRVEAALVGEPATDAARAVASAPPAPFQRRPIVRDDPEEVVVDVTGASGLLVLADAFAPGWEAEVDGASRPLWQANYLVRAVLLEPGDREVTFRYRAPGFALGASLAVGAWFAALALLLIGRRRAAATVAC
jgi:hypothetical protein